MFVNAKKFRKHLERRFQWSDAGQRFCSIVGNIVVLHRHQPAEIEQTQVAFENIAAQRCQSIQPAIAVDTVFRFILVKRQVDNQIACGASNRHAVIAGDEWFQRGGINQGPRQPHR